MTLVLTSELEARLVAAARQHAVDPSRFAGDLLNRALDTEPDARKQQPSYDDLMAGLQALAQTATAVRNYPEDFFSRDVIYADHD